MDNMLIGVFVLVVFIIVVLVKTAVVVEQQYEYVIERLGKYRTTLEAGFHILIPFFDKVAYKRSLKEQSIDMLIMGAFGHSPLRTLMFGSKTADLLRSSTVPTLLLR